MKAILVERDYKGEFERFALTPDEFKEQFGDFLSEGSDLTKEEPGSFTVQHLVHIWYQPSDVGSEMWNRFFTDMTWGLSEGDIENKNFAYIREDFFKSLKEFLPSGSKAEITEEDIESLQGAIHSLRKELDGAIAYDPDMVPIIDKQLSIKEFQLMAAQNGYRLEQSRLEARWEAAGALFESAKAQLEKGNNKTTYGEPQAFIELPSGRTIEITLEQDGLSENEQFYSCRLHCGEEEYNAHESTVGLIEQYTTDSPSLDDLKDILILAVLHSEAFPVGLQPRQAIQERGEDTVENNYADKISRAYEALAEALEAVDATEEAGIKIHPSIGNRLSTAKLILAELTQELSQQKERENETPEHNVVAPLTPDSNIKQWYVSSYPQDEAGQNIAPNLSFQDIVNTMNDNKDFYGVIEVPGSFIDTLVRERIFAQIAELYGVEYNIIYNKWLNHETAPNIPTPASKDKKTPLADQIQSASARAAGNAVSQDDLSVADKISR